MRLFSWRLAVAPRSGTFREELQAGDFLGRAVEVSDRSPFHTSLMPVLRERADRLVVVLDIALDVGEPELERRGKWQIRVDIGRDHRKAEREVLTHLQRRCLVDTQ